VTQPRVWSVWSLCALVLAVPLLLPFSRAVEAPVLMAALIGIGALWRHRAILLSQPQSRLLLMALGAYSLASLLAAIDAVAPAKSWSNALTSLRFLAFGLGHFALLGQALTAGFDARRLGRWLTLAAAAPIALWVIDGLVQAATGYSLGGGLDADRLSGIFGADDLKLGPLLSALSPLLLWPLLQRPRWLLGLAYLAILVVILLAGARAGWVSYALVSGLLAWRLARGSWSALLAWGTAAAILAGALTVVGYQLSDNFQARVDRTLAAGDGQVDVALAGRLPIWRTATRMALAHPVNGVGARGFRYAYPEYADADDPWVDPQLHTGAAHAHQMLFELLTETGVIGLLLWSLAAGQLWRCARLSRSDPSAQAPWIALAVLCFPLNTHLAFYSVFMSIVLAWLLTIACLQSALFAVAVDRRGPPLAVAP
jgi:O-antigen ligase